MIKSNIRRFVRIAKEYGAHKAIIIYCLYTFHRKSSYITYLKKLFKTEFSDIINNYRNAPVDGKARTNKTVWCLWWQGLETAPLIPKICIESIKNNIPDDYKFVLLTEGNYEKYVKIPSSIMRKFRENKITLTHFSDIIRQYLLCEKGGVWIDATVYIPHKMPTGYFGPNSFWSVKTPSEKLDRKSYGQAISRGDYAGFILGGKTNSITLNFIKECTERYWEKHNSLIEYFIQITQIKIAQENISSANNEIESYPINNPNVYELDRLMSLPYDEKMYKKITSDTYLFKLSWKKEYLEEVDGHETFFGMIKRQHERTTR